MIARLIQRQLQIGTEVAFSLKNGRSFEGTLVEIGLDHVTLENKDGMATILLEMIGTWENLDGGNDDSRPIESEVSPKSVDGEAKTHAAQFPTQNANKFQEHTTALDEPTLRKLIEIDSRFKAQLATARLNIIVPTFDFNETEFPSQHRANVRMVWDRVYNKYKYAEKINELSSKFGRIQPIAQELRGLAERFPSSPSIKSHLGYLYYLLGKRNQASIYYKEAASSASKATDWHNLAVLALETEERELACYALQQVFIQLPINDHLETWFVYLDLVMNVEAYSSLFTFTGRLERELSDEELKILGETAIFLAQVKGEEAVAHKIAQSVVEGHGLDQIIVTAFESLGHGDNPTYQKIVQEHELKEESQRTETKSPSLRQPQGNIYIYKPSRNFGFLKDRTGNNFFFHRSAIIDPTLYDRLKNLNVGEQIPVTFEPAEGPKGPLALRVALYRTVEELFELANACAEDGDYSRAIGYIRQVIERDMEYSDAQTLYDKWREYARVSGVPRGANPYARAKRVQLIEKDLDRAARLFRQAISQGDNVESAVKDLASVLVQQGQAGEAIRFLQENRKKVQDQRSVDNMLIGFYQNAGHYEQAISLLQNKLSRASSREKKAHILWQIGNCYLRHEAYERAKSTFESVSKLHPDNLAARRNIAICYFKQEKFTEAEQVLNNILDTSPDAKAAELLEAITQAKATGQSSQIDEIIVDTTLSDFSRELSEFTQFFLERCEFQGVPPDRVRAQKFNRFDIRKLEELATQLGTRRPRDRAGYYLSAAKIISIIEGESTNQFYRYLCRSFASSGDATIAESKPLDAARELYCEALSIYDRDRSKRKDEQDAVNALVRFLFSTLGQSQVPLVPHIPSIDETIEQAIRHHPQRDRVFDAISYLIFRSRYAANRMLKRLYAGSSLQTMALEYIEKQGIHVSRPIKQFDDFVQLWNELRRRKFDEWRAVSGEFRFLLRIELTTASLGAGIERLKAVNHQLFFDLDRERVRQLQTILENTLDLVKQLSFEEQERLCIQIDSRCNELLREIELSPTKLSLEELYPVIIAVREKVKGYLEELYVSSIPHIELRLPVESYVPDNNQVIEVQIVIANKMGRSPAESLELIVQEDSDFFEVITSEIRLDESLRGGEQRIFVLRIYVASQALRSQTFSLPMYAQYRTRSGESEQTTVHNFSIRLYPKEEFEPIVNPYQAYAEGGIVGDPTMFYGRDDLISNIERAIQESRIQSKSIVVFGQKRAGKSSILYHLKRRMIARGELLVLDIGNIGSILDEQSTAPLLYQILWSILRKLEFAIEDLECDEGYQTLALHFPSDKNFYSHPSPLILFKDVFEQFSRKASRKEEWKDLRVVLLIDEFSYIYGLIMSQRVPELFMKNWKALLQENYFSVVMAGQDVMPKFKQLFPNEFGTTQDERVSYLKRTDAVKLIDEPIRVSGESRYRERAIDLIVDLTAGSPFYIQIICDRLVKYMNEKRAMLVTEADIEQVKNELIRGVNALSLDKFDNLINSGDTSDDAISDEDALQVLRAIAVNSLTGPCNRNSIICETSTHIDIILDDLVNREVIDRERERYYQIRVGLFKEWLLAH